MSYCFSRNSCDLILKTLWSEFAAWGWNPKIIIILIPLRKENFACFSWYSLNEDVSSFVAEIIWISCFLGSWTVPSKCDLLKNVIGSQFSSCGLDSITYLVRCGNALFSQKG